MHSEHVYYNSITNRYLDTHFKLVNSKQYILVWFSLIFTNVLDVQQFKQNSAAFECHVDE